MANKAFIVAGIKNLLKKNYGIDPQTIDVDARVDSTLDFGENWTIIKEFVHLPDSPIKYFMCKHCSKRIKCDWIYCPICGKLLEEE